MAINECFICMVIPFLTTEANSTFNSNRCFIPDNGCSLNAKNRPDRIDRWSLRFRLITNLWQRLGSRLSCFEYECRQSR